MNYGYQPAAPSEVPQLKEEDELNRYSIQLYHYVATAVNIEDKAVLEVGCGRGGGSSYIKRYLNPKTMVGMDYSKQAIHFCRENHHVEKLSFQQGDAEALPFADNSFDVIVNVESSHCYGSMPKFVNEVHRVLRPGGYLLFADLRGKDETAQLQTEMNHAGMKIIRKVDIAPNVLQALDGINEQRLAFIEDLSQGWLAKPFRAFLGVKGSQIYENISAGKIEYWHYVLEKKT